MMNSRFRLSLGLLVLMKMIAVAHAGASAAHPTAEIEAARLKMAMTLLERTESGKAALEKMRSLSIPVKSAPVSKTDIIATRKSDGSKESYSYEVQVLIAGDKDPVFQALDLAHELVHATHPNKNPFDPKLSATDYVRHGIEGDGGEAQAIAAECKVGKEMIDMADKTDLKNETAQLIRARCQYVWNTQANPSKWTQSFYQVGQHYREFAAKISEMNLHLKVESKSPIFSSAAAHKPYPLALLDEYIEITKVICSKNRKIASDAVTALQERCESVGAN